MIASVGWLHHKIETKKKKHPMPGIITCQMEATVEQK
jgi:hypothetical protein